MTLNSWISKNFCFAQAQKPGLNLDVLAKRVAEFLSHSNQEQVTNGDVVRALKSFRYKFSDIMKREKELDVSFLSLVNYYLHQY